MDRPRWKMNLAGIRGAVGYRDSAGKPVSVVNWEALLTQPKRNMSEKREDALLSDEAPQERR